MVGHPERIWSTSTTTSQTGLPIIIGTTNSNEHHATLQLIAMFTNSWVAKQHNCQCVNANQLLKIYERILKHPRRSSLCVVEGAAACCGLKSSRYVIESLTQALDDISAA